jgi:porphyrinogen peroxidase
VPTPQPGIFALGTRSQHHLEFDVSANNGEVAAAVLRIWDAASSVAGVNVVVGFGHRIWSTLAPDAVPVGLKDFERVAFVDGFEMPATQHDLWLWFHGAGPDAVFQMARVSAMELLDLAEVATEQGAFTFRESKDLTGFEDGTANPPVADAIAAATVPEGLPGAGGSVVLLQKWVHDLDGFEALELADREQVIGRTFVGSIELEGDAQPPDSHTSRVVIENDDGVELEIFRRSAAYGGILEHGLMFLAFSADHARLQRMLERMAGGEDGVRDRLTRFSTPVHGAWYYAPPVDTLRALGG